MSLYNSLLINKCSKTVFDFFLKKSTRLCFYSSPATITSSCFHQCWTKRPREKTQKQPVKVKGLCCSGVCCCCRVLQKQHNNNNSTSKKPRALFGLWKWRRSWPSAGGAVLGWQCWRLFCNNLGEFNGRTDSPQNGSWAQAANFLLLPCLCVSVEWLHSAH